MTFEDDLTPSEAVIYGKLAATPDKVATADIEAALYPEGALKSSLRVLVCRLKKKLVRHGLAEKIETIHGYGYQLVKAG